MGQSHGCYTNLIFELISITVAFPYKLMMMSQADLYLIITFTEMTAAIGQKLCVLIGQ